MTDGQAEPLLEQGSTLGAGQLLLAHPLEDSWFKRTAVLLCAHSPVHGSYGLSLNVPLPSTMPPPSNDEPNIVFFSGTASVSALHPLTSQMVHMIDISQLGFIVSRMWHALLMEISLIVHMHFKTY